MSQDPFSRPGQYPTAHPVSPRRTQTWVYVAVILGILFLFVSLLLFAASLLALNHVGMIGTPDVPVTDGVSADMAAYANSLVDQSASPTIDEEIRQWLEDHSDEPNGYFTHDLPFNKKLFMQAVAQSPQATSIGIEARLTMVSWLDEFFPQPETLDHYSLLSTQRIPDPTTNKPSNFAVVNLYFYEGYYDGFSEGMSSRWYLHKDSEGWKLYDTQRLELGRRTSDEWAHYLSNLNSPFADAYDESKANLVGADDIDVIRKEEHRKVLPKDSPVKQLLVAQAYQYLEAYDDALRVLDTITDPDLRWGVLTSKSHVLSAMQRDDEATVAANELLSISPNHPNGLYAICRTLESSKRFDELRPYLLRLFRICPNDWHVMEQLVKIATPDDLNSMLAASRPGTDSDAVIETLLDKCFDQDEAFPNVLKNWRQHSPSLSHVSESSWNMIEAAEKFADGDAFAAAELLQQTAEKYPECPAASYLEGLINNAASNAFQWCDSHAMSESNRLYKSVETPTLLNAVVNTQNIFRSGEKSDESISALMAMMNAGSESDIAQSGYLLRYRLEELFSTLFECGKIDEIQPLIDCIASNETLHDKVKLEHPRAGLLLYRNHLNELLEKIREWDPDDLSDWLGESYVIGYLDANPAKALALLSTVTLVNAMDYWTSVTDPVVVFNRESVRPDESTVRTWVESVTSVPFNLSQVTTTTSDETKGLATWKLDLDHGFQLLITVSEAHFDESFVESAELIDALQSSHHVVVVEAIAGTATQYCSKEGNPFADQALVWELARQSVTDASIGVYAWRNGAYWACNAQNQTDLQWDNGFPNRSDAITSYYISPLQTIDDSDDTSVDSFVTALDAGKTAVQCHFNATVASEIVDAELLRVDAETETAEIQLTVDSQFFPILKAGQKLSCSVYELRLKE